MRDRKNIKYIWIVQYKIEQYYQHSKYFGASIFIFCVIFEVLNIITKEEYVCHQQKTKIN